jgi:O-antigen/teichoic acid export membrane protein
VQSLKRALSLITFKSLPIDSEDDLHRESARQALLSSILALFVKILSLVVLLLSMRLALPALGEEKFGAWVTIASLSALLGFLDFGVANGLIGLISKAHALGEEEAVQTNASEGFILLLILGIIVAGIGIGIANLISLNLLFKGAKQTTLYEAYQTLIIFCVLFGLSMPAQGLLKIYTGLQLGWIAQAVTAAALLCSIAILLLTMNAVLGMKYYYLIVSAPQQLSGFLLLIPAIKRRLIKIPHRTKSIKQMVALPVVQHGGLFFIMQIGTTVIVGANQLLVSALLGPAIVALLALGQRLFLPVTQFPAIANAPLWPIYAEADAKGQSTRLRRMFVNSLLYTLLFAVLSSLIIIIWNQYLADLLSGGALSISSDLLWLFAIWSILEATGSAVSIYLNGRHIVRPQIIMLAIHILIGLPIKVYLTATFGLKGLLVGTISAYILFTMIPLLTYFRKDCFNFKDTIQ